MLSTEGFMARTPAATNVVGPCGQSSRAGEPSATAKQLEYPGPTPVGRPSPPATRRAMPRPRPRISVFPKCYFDELYQGKMDYLDWVRRAATLGAEGLEHYDG